MATKQRWKNFDAIRLGAATSVVLSHSFLLSSTGYSAEPLVRVFGLHHDIGLMAVGVFFIISGFLITQSYARRATTLAYLLNRVMRIFPGLVVCTLITAFAIGPMFAASPGGYLTSSETWAYVWHTVLLQPGGGTGFAAPLYDGQQGGVMLGTTWSLSPEFACYFGVLIAGTVGMLRLPAALALVAFGVWSHSQWSSVMLASTAWALMFFAAGAVLHFVHQARRPTHAMVVAAGAGMVVVTVAGYPMEALAVFGSVVLIQLATSERISLGDAARYGDLSYGVYLYGWPAQQLVRAVWGPSITWWQMFLAAMPIALACAWLSWHLVEARALEVARAYSRRAREASPTAEAVPATTLAAGV